MDFSIKNNSINNIKTKPNEVKNMDEDLTFQDQVDGMLKTFSERMEREVPEYGDFSPVMEFFPSLDKNSPVGKYGLKLYKMPKDIDEDPKQRYLEAAAYLPAGDYKADMIVGKGRKEEIQQLLKDPEFPIRLNKAYGKLLGIIEAS